LTTIATGSQADVSYSATSATSQPNQFSSPSFSISTHGSSLTGGNDPALTWSINTPYVTLYTYDALGNLTCIEQHGGVTGTGCSSQQADDATSPWRVRRFTYDSLTRLLSTSNPETGTINYVYDPNSNVVSRTAPLPNQNPGSTTTVTTTYSYDALNRLTKKTYTDSTAAAQYGYDGVSLSGCTINPPPDTDSYRVGRRTSMCDGSGATTWIHDQMGRVTQERRAISAVTESQWRFIARSVCRSAASGPRPSPNSRLGCRWFGSRVCCELSRLSAERRDVIRLATDPGCSSLAGCP